MARKPIALPDPALPLPAAGGAYELVDGQLRPVSEPEEAPDATPETLSETGV